MESLTSLAAGDFSVSCVAGKRKRGCGLAVGRDSLFFQLGWLTLPSVPEEAHSLRAVPSGCNVQENHSKSAS
jgi:hypothetical protein